MTAYLLALATTLVLECAVVAVLAARAERRSLTLDMVAVNLVTHPLAVWLYWFGGWSAVAIEAWVWLGEIALLRVLGHPFKRGLQLAVVANAISTAASWPLGWWELFCPPMS